VSFAVHLKSLTLRGFKSFADATTLEFEPGVTVVVGPNGSGKSNVVDAVAWVLGAQGPRVVRSAKMDDVIFAGTAKRAPLGRAEVTLTIDNSSRRLPIDLAEVTITRTLFRTGESEYQMNGASCRLLDIQEMLSDAGVGRTQHVIMSQGQLASVLDARPEERRAVIEEAAGILKFRRRRERAERRLEGTEANLLRLQDLLREVRRQLRPLERQAEAARRHESFASELRALQLYVAGRELDSLRRRAAENEERKVALAADEERLSAGLGRLDATVASSEEALSAEQASDIVSVLAEADRLRERARGVANVVAERRRRVQAALEATTEADVVSSLDAESSRLRRELADVAEMADALGPEWERLSVAEAELPEPPVPPAHPVHAGGPGSPGGAGAAAAADRLSAAAQRRLRDEALRTLSSAREALARQSERAESLARQREELTERVAGVEAELVSLAASAEALREEQAAAERSERDTADRVNEAEAVARAAGERTERLRARAGALREALDDAHARAGLERLAGRPGVLGTLLDVIEIDEGLERAFEAAAEDALRAVVVDSGSSARAAIEHLRAGEASGAVLTAGPLRHGAGIEAAQVPAGFPLLRSHVRGTTPAVAVLLDRLLSGVVVCRTGISAALDLVAECGPGAVVVTLEGDRLSDRGWRLGAGQSGATRAALDGVLADLSAAEAEAGEAQAAAEAARQAWNAARAAASEASRSAASASAAERERRGLREDFERRILRADSESEQLEAGLAEASERVEEAASRVEACEAALAIAEQAEAEAQLAATDLAERRRLFDEQARAVAAIRADLEVRSAAIEERRTVLTERLNEIERRLAGLEVARAGAAERRQVEEAAAIALERVGRVIGAVLDDLERAIVQLSEGRRRHDEAVASISERLATARSERATTERELAAVREQFQRGELERAELRVRLETALESLRHDLDAEVADALAAECPELPPGIPAVARVRELEREIRLLGPINPLALEELAGLEERDRFLTGQLEDVRNSRRELGRVIRAVDQEIVSVFAEAFADVSQHFEHLFSTLFPGGTGRLTLIDPEDLLSSGIEIEARPGGKNVRRLSLLSGGERSLVALAFLFAVFRSRPSPFYLMDEVEAALDDVNLHRFLDLVDEFRDEAQLLIVSHQKRTMESADIIYGVTMQPGGASKVVSERLKRNEEPASA
jgi:chromosome segregation protein